jgi:hypothetical protein
MPRVLQPGGGGGKMRVRYTARRKRGLVAASKRMQAILWPAVFASVGSPNDLKFLRISDLCRNQYELLLNRLNSFQLHTIDRGIRDS